MKEATKQGRQSVLIGRWRRRRRRGQEGRAAALAAAAALLRRPKREREHWLRSYKETLARRRPRQDEVGPVGGSTLAKKRSASCEKRGQTERRGAGERARTGVGSAEGASRKQWRERGRKKEWASERRHGHRPPFFSHTDGVEERKREGRERPSKVASVRLAVGAGQQLRLAALAQPSPLPQLPVPLLRAPLLLLDRPAAA